MDTCLRDLRYSLRRLIKEPGFTLLAILTLTLGIGATTAIFTRSYAPFRRGRGSVGARAAGQPAGSEDCIES